MGRKGGRAGRGRRDAAHRVRRRLLGVLFFFFVIIFFFVFVVFLVELVRLELV